MITQNEISSLNLSPTKKDFVQIWNELIEVASKITERWDPTSTNESDPGIVLLKVLAGIADKLNYNIDKNILEAYMPTAAQMESMRKLCELVGYDIKYYQSAETKVRISYTGNTTDLSADNDEKLPVGGLALPKFTTITNADKDITFVTTNTLPVLFTNDTPWVEVPCIEGQISQCESVNDSNLISLSQLDADNRYYLPEIQIAENGIFVYNATTSLTDGDAWTQVSNLNTQPSGSRVYKFGYDSLEGRPYLAFPTDIGSLIEDGLFIYFIRTSGLSGNISPETLEVIEIPTGDTWKDYSAEQFEVVNVDATTNGANIESISAAYNNFKKTVGTFDTLVTCRDYMNKIYSLMDASNSPYVSNILVTDIRNDINNAITLCSCNEFGILYKEMPLVESISTDCSVSTVEPLDDANVYKLVIKKDTHDVMTKPKIDHFDLVLYPFKTFTKVSASTKKLASQYNKSFTYTESMNREIEASLDEFKTCAHNFATPAYGDIVAINNYLRLNALIATSTRVSEIEAEAILQNVKVALVNEFNLRNLDFGEEIPFDSILSVIENADSRIKAVSLQEPMVLTTYSVKELEDSTVTSKEYGIISTVGDIAGETIDGVDYTSPKAKEIYNKLVLRNILAGRASLFDYNETFVPNNYEKPYTITKDITNALNDTTVLLKDSIINNPPLTDKQIADLPDEELENLTVKFASTAEKLSAAVEAAMAVVTTPGELILHDVDGRLIKEGFYSDNSVLTLRVFKQETHTETSDTTTPETSESNISGEYKYELYETYEHNFIKKDSDVTPVAFTRNGTSTPSTNNIIDNVARVEAVCEISKPSSSGSTFKNITLGKNEVIKFRAPNLITTKTFPAYVYYRFERDGINAQHTANGTAGGPYGSYAAAVSLNTFINTYGLEEFFLKLSKLLEDNKIKPKTFVIKASTGNEDDQSNELPSIFSTSKAVWTTGTYDIKYAADGSLDVENSTYSQDDGITVCTDRTKIGNCYTIASKNNTSAEVEFYYYPLVEGTKAIWSNCVRSFDSSLPNIDGTTFWRLSSTSNYPKGRLVVESGKRLLAHDGDTLATGPVGEIVYICIEHGEDPVFSTITDGSDVELHTGDRLFIHYTPSSTNEDGETVNAEPVSIVYEGGKADDPVILKPSGFTLTPSDDVHRQGTSWKKTDVEFAGYGKRNLLSLAPNEQIELRSISKVVLDSTARFYKNFDNEELEQGSSKNVITYELKDGEYLFYTDQNTQEAAYYGSGSVITLDKQAYIPRASEPVEISQILEQGLRIVPWSSEVLLSPNKKITITEYQYTTLVEGDTLNTLTLEPTEIDRYGKYAISSAREIQTINDTGELAYTRAPWVKCLSTKADPITYTAADAENVTELPRIELTSGPSTAWEVCSFLELSTSPGYSQSLRAALLPQEAEVGSGSEANAVSITNKITVYTDNSTDSTDIEITPQKATIPASNGKETFEPVSFKLNTIVQAASGNFEKVDNNSEDTANTTDALSNRLQMKVFSEEAPLLLNLNSSTAIVTPISVKAAESTVVNSYAVASTTNINNYWSAIDIANKLASTDRPKALNLNFMIPDSDMFGIFSIYLETSPDTLNDESHQSMLKNGYRVFIEIPEEFGTYNEVVSIFNYQKTINDATYYWWSESFTSSEQNTRRLYLRSGLNCIKVAKSCNLLIKAEDNATGTLIYDNLRLVNGRDKQGVNLKLIDYKTTSTATPTDTQLAEALLSNIAALDKDYEFYYNAPIENSLAIEFDKNISSFSNPYTLYDVNNINNDFVISKLDVADLDTGLKIAKSSRY